MWKIFRQKTIALGVVLALGAGNSALAQSTSITNTDVSGFSLPGVSMPSGSDEIRAADGTTCRSAVSGTGAYIDAGLIGNPSGGVVGNDLSAYGRVVIPLGRKAKRLDCSKLYELEVRRLEIEIRMMEMGLGTEGRVAKSSDAENDEANWVEEGWSNEGKN